MNSSEEDNLSNSSKTNWERIDALTDDEIDVSDLPPLTDEFFAKAKWLMPGDKPVDEARLATLRELAAQAQELDMGY